MYHKTKKRTWLVTRAWKPRKTYFFYSKGFLEESNFREKEFSRNKYSQNLILRFWAFFAKLNSLIFTRTIAKLDFEKVSSRKNVFPSGRVNLPTHAFPETSAWYPTSHWQEKLPTRLLHLPFGQILALAAHSSSSIKEDKR